MGLLSRNKNKETVTLATLGDVELALGSSSMFTSKKGWSSEQFEDEGKTSKIPYDVKEMLFFFEPISQGGIEKTSGRLFGNWFYMDDPTQDQTIDAKKNQELMKFHRDINLDSKLALMNNDVMAYGNGYLELEAERGIQNSKEPLLPETGIKNVHNVDPKMIKEKIVPIDKQLGTFYYVHQGKFGEEYYIHNTRLIHKTWSTLGTMRFGKGIYDIAIRTMLAKIGMDWSIGEVMYRYGKPFLVLTTDGATRNDMKKANKILQKINPKTGFFGSDKHHFDMLNPTLTNPTPFAEYYYYNISAACRMPHMELLGAQSGKLTGSEVDKTGWNQTLQNIQKFKYSSVVHTINNYFLKGNWFEEIYWNEIFVDQKMKAEIDKLRTETAKIMQYDMGVMLDSEARQWFRDNGVPFPKDDTDWDKETDEDESEIPELPFPDDTEYENRKKSLIERLKDAEFMVNQEEFWRKEYGKK